MQSMDHYNWEEVPRIRYSNAWFFLDSVLTFPLRDYHKGS